MGDTFVVVVVQVAIDLAHRDDDDINRTIGEVIVRSVMGGIPYRLIERGGSRHSQCMDRPGATAKQRRAVSGDLGQGLERA